MYTTKTLLFLLLFASINIFGNQEAKKQPCVSKEACLNDPNCLCWCSQICNWRKKTPEDHPVYIENDPYGKFCYCKQWDFDHYEDNCIYGRNVQEPTGAK
jgi:hypothetical protein